MIATFDNFIKLILLPLTSPSVISKKLFFHFDKIIISVGYYYYFWEFDQAYDAVPAQSNSVADGILLFSILTSFYRVVSFYLYYYFLN